MYTSKSVSSIISRVYSTRPWNRLMCTTLCMHTICDVVFLKRFSFRRIHTYSYTHVCSVSNRFLNLFYKHWFATHLTETVLRFSLFSASLKMVWTGLKNLLYVYVIQIVAFFSLKNVRTFWAFWQSSSFNSTFSFCSPKVRFISALEKIGKSM